MAVEEFVRDGGTLITLGASSRWAIDLLEIPLVDVTRGDEAKGFSCPGSVLRGMTHDHRLAAGLPGSVPLFFSNSSAFRPMTDEERKKAGIEGDWELETVLRYAPTRVLLSGWIKRPEVIERRAAWVRAGYGRGRVHLFGFRPQYRAWSQATFGLVFRAALLDRDAD